MLLKTVVAVNKLSIHRAVATWYISTDTADTVDLNESLDISPKLVANITNHEPLDLFDQASRNQSSAEIWTIRDMYLARQDSQNARKWDNTFWTDRHF